MNGCKRVMKRTSTNTLRGFSTSAPLSRDIGTSFGSCTSCKPFWATPLHTRHPINARAERLNAREGELGVQPPVGFWDPLGLSADGDLDVFKRRSLDRRGREGRK